jgi:hypothetical protein
LEASGIATVVLTPTWEFHRLVGIPRSVAIAYPYGRPLGQVGDRYGQRKVVLAALNMLETATTAGSVSHLPEAWPEAPKDTHWHPPEMSPIIKAYLKDIKKAARRKAG